MNGDLEMGEEGSVGDEEGSEGEEESDDIGEEESVNDDHEEGRKKKIIKQG